MFRSLALVALLALSPAAALAVDPPAATADRAQPNPNRRVCRPVQDTGWRTGSGRICKSQADWDRIARQNREDYERTISPPTITLNSPDATVRDGPALPQ